MKARTNGILVLWLSDVIFSTDYFIKFVVLRCCAKQKKYYMLLLFGDLMLKTLVVFLFCFCSLLCF